MAFNVGIGSKDAFKELKKLAPRQRLDAVKSQDAATILTMLTPAQFAELFPDYYKRGLPDVSGFREAISRKSRQKQDDINFGLSQGAKSVEEAEKMGTWRRRFGGKDGMSVDEETRKISSPVMAKEIYNYLRSKNVDHVHAMGILANIQGESAFNAGAQPSAETMRREGGPSGGLFQHHDNPSRGEYRFTNMVKAAGGPGAWQKNWKGQIDYALSEPDMKKYLSRQFSDEKEAVRGFIVDFERPRNPDSDYSKRVSYLQSIDSAVKSENTTGSDVSKVSAKSGGFFGESEQCVALSKHFSGLGAASGWKVKSGNITAGTVIATTSYNDGSGGKMAKNMPDGKSHYHTGIALTAPNGNGDVLILEQFAGQPARVRSININDYNGEKWGVVEGGDPNAGTMRAVELGKSLANKDQLAWIESGGGAPTATAEIKPTQQASVVRPTATTNDQPAAQYPDQQQQTQQTPAQQQKPETAKVEKVDNTKKTFETYKFDPDKYYNEVNTKHPEAKFFGYDKDRIMKDTYKGFEEAQAAGAIKWNRKTNEIQIVDPNHEKVQSIYKDMQDNNIDRNQFMTRSEAGGDGTATVRRVKSKIDSAELQQARNLNKQHLLQAMNEHKILDPNKRAAMAAVVQGESGFIPKSESDYSTTSNKRIRSIFRTATKGMSDAQLTALKKSPEAFFNKIYGGKLGNAPDEGYMYRGRGMVQLTGKLNYAKYGEKIGMKDELLKNPDLANRPDIAAKLAVAYMEDRTRKRGRDIYTKVARGVGNPVASTEKVKKAAYQQFAQSGEFAPGRQAILPDQRIQVATSTRVEKQPGVTTPTVGSQTTPTEVAAAQKTKGTFEKAKDYAQNVYESAKTSLLGTTAQAKPTATTATPMATTPSSTSAAPPPTMANPQIDVTPMSKAAIPAAGNIQSKEMRDMLNTMQDMSTNMQTQPAPTPPTIDRSEAPQKPVVIDSFLTQKTTGFPTPSLERAMSKARGRESDYSANRVGTGTSIA